MGLVGDVRELQVGNAKNHVAGRTAAQALVDSGVISLTATRRTYAQTAAWEGESMFVEEK